MIRILFYVLLLSLSAYSSATDKIDSLKYELFNYGKEDEQKVRLLNQLGYEYWIISPMQSIIYGQQAKALSEVLQFPEGQAFANRVIGVAHWARGSYDQGLAYLLEGLDGYHLLKDTLGEANVLMNIGLIYSDRTDDELALKYFFDALKGFEAVGAEDRSATTYVKMATIFIRQGDINAAYDFLGRALRTHSGANFLYGVSEILHRYGMLKIKTEEYDSANIYLQRSMDVSNRIGDVDGMARNYIDLADVALFQGKTSAANQYLNEALRAAKQVRSHKWLKEVYDRLQRIARKEKNYEEVIAYLDQYIQQKDSILNEQSVNNLARLEAELATAEQKRQLEAKEREIVILEQNAQIQRTQILIFILISVGIVLFVYLVNRNKRLLAQQNEKVAKEEAEQARRDLEFKNRELVSYTVNFVQKNQLFEELSQSIASIKKSTGDADRKALIVMERTIKKHLQVDKDWEDFKIRFENLHTGFFDKLTRVSSSLTSNDLKLCALTRMNFSIKEIAEMMGISSESVKTARYRLKKKLTLDPDVSINDFLNSIQ